VGLSPPIDGLELRDDREAWNFISSSKLDITAIIFACMPAGSLLTPDVEEGLELGGRAANCPLATWTEASGESCPEETEVGKRFGRGLGGPESETERLGRNGCSLLFSPGGVVSSFNLPISGSCNVDALGSETLGTATSPCLDCPSSFSEDESPVTSDELSFVMSRDISKDNDDGNLSCAERLIPAGHLLNQ
jgi:hypothetical protein